MLPTWLRLIGFALRRSKIIFVSDISGLGDYLYTRPYLSLIRQSPRYKNFKLVFCGNRRWEKFARGVDGFVVDAFLFIRHPGKVMWQEKLVLKMVRAEVALDLCGAGNLHCPSRYVCARQTFTNEVAVGLPLFYSECRRRVFQQIVEVPENFQPTLDVVPHDRVPDGPYAVVVPSGFSSGFLSVTQLTGVIRFLIDDYGLTVVLTSINRDYLLVDDVMARLNGEQRRRVVLENRLQGHELPYLVQRAEIVVAPNTSVHHMALLLNTDCVCLSPGDSPLSRNSEHPRVRYVFSDQDEALLRQGVEMPYRVHWSLEEIPVERVLVAVRELLGPSRAGSETRDAA